MDRGAVVWVASLLVAGCAVDRSGLAGTGDGGPLDARLDAAQDAPSIPPPVDARMDAAPDAPSLDAGSDGNRPEAGSDSGGPDAGGDSCDATDPLLIVCLPFEGDFMDRSGSGNHAAATAVSFVPGRVGQAARFTAASGLVVATSDVFSSEDLTMELWVRADVIPGAGARAGLLDQDGRASIFLYSDGDVRCDGAGGPVWDLAGLRAGVWTHYACVTSTTVVQIFRDGALVAEQPGVGTSGPLSGLYIGENGTDGADQLLGALDEVRVYNRRVSASEIRAEYLRGVSP